jgi:hypothetical protein
MFASTPPSPEDKLFETRQRLSEYPNFSCNDWNASGRAVVTSKNEQPKIGAQ